jgi:hypothetical protein
MRGNCDSREERRSIMAAKIKKSKGKVSKGDKYSCAVCGMVVTVDEVCGCMDVCDIICCGTQMAPKKR